MTSTTVSNAYISNWEEDILHIANSFTQWLCSWNSSVNPVLYGFLNSKFQKKFLSIVPRWTSLVRNKSELRRNMRYSGYHVTVSNGTCTCTFVTPGHSTGIGTRDNFNISGRNSYRRRNLSPRFHNWTPKLLTIQPVQNETFLVV